MIHKIACPIISSLFNPHTTHALVLYYSQVNMYLSKLPFHGQVKQFAITISGMFVCIYAYVCMYIYVCVQSATAKLTFLIKSKSSHAAAATHTRTRSYEPL